MTEQNNFTRATALLLAASGPLTISACSPDVGSDHVPTVTSVPVPGNQSSTSKRFNFDTLPKSNDGVCLSPRASQAVLNCVILPPVTEGAHFVDNDTAPSNPESEEPDTERVIGEITSSYEKLDLLPPAYQAVFKKIANDPLPKEAIANGVRFVIEQQPKTKDIHPQTVNGSNLIRLHLQTDGTSQTVGEVRAVATHEAAHAVTDKWDWSGKTGKNVNKLYSETLYLATYDVNAKSGNHIDKLYGKYSADLNTFIAKSDLNLKNAAILKDNAASAISLVRSGGLGVMFVDTFADKPHVAPARRALFNGFDVGKLTGDLVPKLYDQTTAIDKFIKKEISNAYAYNTEYKQMDGMVEWSLGHPWDNRGEYVASLITNVQFAPDKLVNSAMKLKGEQRRIHLQLVAAIAALYKEQDPDLYKTSNFESVLAALRKAS